MKYLFFILVILKTLACRNSSNTLEMAVGHYVNRYNPLAVHKLTLNSDGTFLHEYKDAHGILINRGSWLLGDHGRDILFDRWRSFGDSLDDKCLGEGCYATVQLHDGELRFDYDRPEVNFQKIADN